jgi:hypothetical protein
MCDYSLEHVASRAAEVGDKLISTRFGGSFTRGFAGDNDRNVAVCLRPGTELAFDKEVEFENVCEGGRQTVSAKVARFRQVDLETKHLHHDALEFPGGRLVLLTRLVEGQHATVLQLPALAQPAAAEQKKELSPIA